MSSEQARQTIGETFRQKFDDRDLHRQCVRPTMIGLEFCSGKIGTAIVAAPSASCPPRQSLDYFQASPAAHASQALAPP